MIQYSGEQKMDQMRPLPDLSRTVVVADLVALAKNENNKLAFCEDLLGVNRCLTEKRLEKALGLPTAREWLYKLEVNMLRYALSKLTQLDDFSKVKVMGKWGGGRRPWL